MNATQIIKPINGIMSKSLLLLALFFAMAAPVAIADLPTAGLVLHVEADTGVTTAAGTTDVTDWADQSTQGNDLTAAGAPQLVTDAVNGEAAVSFDGTDDILERLASVTGLPADDADRTMYLVAKYDSTGYGGASYGAAANNETFGLVVHINGNLTVQGWGVANDFNSGIAGTGMDWMVQSAVHEAGTMTHFQNTPAFVAAQMAPMQIDTQVHTYATNPTSIVLGAEIDRAPFMDMEIAAVAIYDRALSAAERADADKFFSVKYMGGVEVDILAPAEGETVSSGDVTVMYAAAGKTFDTVQLVLNGGTPVDLTEATGTHTFNNVAAGAHTLTASLLDNGQPVMLADSTATVNFAAEDCFPDDFAPNCTVDTDGDGAPDSQEGATTDTDGDGTLDYLESSVTDADGDGTPDQSDSNDADPCVPSLTGTGCTPPPPPPQPKSGGGSTSLLWLAALSGLLAARRRRYNGLANS